MIEVNFLTILGAGSPRGGCQKCWFLLPLLSLAIDRCPLPVSSHDLCVCVCLISSSYKDTSHAGLGPALMKSF